MADSKITELAKDIGRFTAGRPASDLIPALAIALLNTIVQGYPDPVKFRKIIRSLMTSMDKDAQAIWKARTGGTE